MKKIGLKTLLFCLVVILVSGCAEKHDTYTITRDNANGQHTLIDRQKNKSFLLEDTHQIGTHGEKILKASEKHLTTEYKATQTTDKKGMIGVISTKVENGVIDNYIVFTAPTDGNNSEQGKFIKTCSGSVINNTCDGITTNDYFIYLPAEFEKTR